MILQTAGRNNRSSPCITNPCTRTTVVALAIGGTVVALALEALAIIGFLGLLHGVNALASGLLIAGGVIVGGSVLAALICRRSQTQVKNSIPASQLAPSPEAPQDILPKNVLIKIFDYVPPKDLIENCTLVCKRWRMRIKEAPLLTAKRLQAECLVRAAQATSAQPIYPRIEQLHIVDVSSHPFELFNQVRIPELRVYYYECAKRRQEGGPFRVDGAIEWKTSTGPERAGNLTTLLSSARSSAGDFEQLTLQASCLFALLHHEHSFTAAKHRTEHSVKVRHQDCAYYLIAKNEVKFNLEAAKGTVEKIKEPHLRAIAAKVITGTLGEHSEEIYDTLKNITEEGQMMVIPDLIVHWGDSNPKQLRELMIRWNDSSAWKNSLYNYGFSKCLCAIACLDPQHDFTWANKKTGRLSVHSPYLVAVQAMSDLEAAKQKAATISSQLDKALAYYYIGCIEGKGNFDEALAATSKGPRWLAPAYNSMIYRIGLAYADCGNTEMGQLCLNKLPRFNDRHRADLKRRLEGDLERGLVYTTLFDMGEFNLFSDLSWLGCSLFKQGRLEEGQKVMKLVSHLAVDQGMKANTLLDFEAAIAKHQATKRIG